MPRASVVCFFLFPCLCLAALFPLSATAVAPPKIAILEFEPVTAAARQSGRGRLVTEMLTTAAVGSGRFEVVERRIISRILEELEFGERGLSYTSAALKVGAMAGATAILSGSVAEDAGKTRIDARYIDVESGRILWAGVAMGGTSLSGVSDAARRVFRDLEAFVAETPPDAGEPAAAAPPVKDHAPATPATVHTDAADGGAGQEPGPQAQAHYQKARELGRAKRYAKAEKEMDAALALSPDRPEYHAARGHARYFQGRHAQALEDYDASLAAHDAQAAVHAMRGLCLVALGQPEKALADYDRALELDRDNADLLIRRGRLLGELGRTADMCRDLEAACGLGQCPPLETARKEGSCPAAP